jgi:hypothetical protein
MTFTCDNQRYQFQRFDQRHWTKSKASELVRSQLLNCATCIGKYRHRRRLLRGIGGISAFFQRVEALGISPDTGEALGIGYAPTGMMKGYVLSLFDRQPPMHD